MSAAIAVQGVRMSFGAFEAVRGVSFEVAAGEVFALLGPNGAGKTTIVEILEGHRRRSGGDVRVLGFDPETGGRAFRERIGIVLQEAGLDGELTVGETLGLFAGFYPDPLAPRDIIDLVGLEAKRNARVRTLSGGQRRRLDLALGLVGNPDVLFLDEPTTGFDPEARRQAWSMLDRLRELGKTTLLTSHYMDEVQRLADRVVVLAAGQVVATGSPASLAGRDLGLAVIRFRLPAGCASQDLPEPIDGQVLVEGREVLVHTERPTAALALLVRWAQRRGGELEALTVTRPSLEETYLQLVSGEADR